MADYNERTHENNERYTAAERLLIEGDALAQNGKWRKALDAYTRGVGRIEDLSRPQPQTTQALLMYSIGELYRAQPHLLPPDIRAEDFLWAADIDESLGNPDLPLRSPDRHGLSYLLHRSMGFIDLQRAIQPEYATHVPRARSELQCAETELYRHLMATAIEQDPETTIDMRKLRAKVDLIDPELQVAIKYTDHIPGLRAQEVLGTPKPSLRSRLLFGPYPPKFTVPHARASELILRG